MRSPRFSGWSPTTWSETRCAAAGACPGKSCPPSPKPDNRIAHTAAGPAGWAELSALAGTHKTLWPAQLHQILATRLLSGKTPLKLLQRPRVVLHSPACYMLGSRESSAYPDVVIVIPPRRSAVSAGPTDGPWAQRDTALERIRQVGRREWQKESGYRQQARVENSFFRYKSVFGGGLKARHSKVQRREAAIGCHILNRMAELGRPSSYALGR